MVNLMVVLKEKSVTNISNIDPEYHTICTKFIWQSIPITV